MRTEIFPAAFEQLDEIREFVGAAALDAGMDNKEIYAVQLATDEACTNVIEHAYGGEMHGQIEITCHVQDRTLTVIIHDHGKSFDPNQVPEPNLNADLSKRRIGGLGIYLMRKLMDEVTYEASTETGNTLTLLKHKGGMG
jgi:serine/threonine-protein kinase RsbW